MFDNIIARQIRRCNRNLLLVNLGIVVLLIWVLVGNQRYLTNCYLGPQQISPSEVLRPSDALEYRYFVSLPKSEPVDAGLEDTSTSYGHTSVTAHYYATQIEGQFLLIKSPSEKPPEKYEGALVLVSSDLRASFQKNILDKKNLQYSRVFLPVMLDASSFRSDAYIGFAIGIPVVLLAAYNVKKALVRIKDYHESPIYKWLGHYQETPEILAAKIDADLKKGNGVAMGNLTMTESWMLYRTFFSYTVMSLTEIAWVYKKVTRHSVNLIPTGTSHGLVIADRVGRMIELDIGRGKGREQRVESFIQTVGQRLPWIVFGYSDELKSLYKKQLAKFNDVVDERFIQYATNKYGDAAGAANG